MITVKSGKSYTVNEAAKILMVSKTTVLRAIRLGMLPAIDDAHPLMKRRRWKITAEDIEEYFRRQSTD